MQKTLLMILLIVLPTSVLASAEAHRDEPTRVFIFAGQSNMVGSDSKVADIQRFPPYAGLEQAQSDVEFAYCIGRENKMRSDGWQALAPVDGVVGPELSFARKVAQRVDAPIAIIKCAAGGTHLGGDWNPDTPSGFEMYPLALDLIRSSLEELGRRDVDYRIEGFMWHQGENDMFEESYMRDYGKNLANFVACVRRDLKSPRLRFYIGELCTKTIWGMDLRPRMHAISLGQRQVTDHDELCDYVRTSQVGVEIGGGVGLHYHYGTLGQLEHGTNYADAYLATIGCADEPSAPLGKWPYPMGGPIKLFVLAGHRNMEGERAFVQELESSSRHRALVQDNDHIPFRYSLGGGYKVSNSWEALGPRGAYGTFGPELSFGRTIRAKIGDPIAILKFTHSGSQIIDWTPEGSEASSRNLFPAFVTSVRSAIADLESKGHTVELAGVFYHIGENDMSFGPYRRSAPERIRSLVKATRESLELPQLKWFLSQQLPTDHERVNEIDVTAELVQLADSDEHVIHIPVFDLPEQEKILVLDTEAVVLLGDRIANAYLALLSPR